MQHVADKHECSFYKACSVSLLFITRRMYYALMCLCCLPHYLWIPVGENALDQYEFLYLDLASIQSPLRSLAFQPSTRGHEGRGDVVNSPVLATVIMTRPVNKSHMDWESIIGSVVCGSFFLITTHRKNIGIKHPCPWNWCFHVSVQLNLCADD